MPKIKVTLSIGYPTASREEVIDVDDDDWNDCETEEERQELMDMHWTTWSNDYIDGSSELVD
jgi:hypothetical protein